MISSSLRQRPERLTRLPHEPAGHIQHHQPDSRSPGSYGGGLDAVTAPPTATTTSGLPRLVDLGSTSCKECKALAPILDELRTEYKGRLSVEFIDVFKNPAAKGPYAIRLIPTQILYDKAGNELWRHEGGISKEALKTLFAEKVGVD